MPSFFYHLKLELYAASPYGLRCTDTQEATHRDPDIHLPPPSTDIFNSPLPAHCISSQPEPPPKRSSHRRSNTVSSGAQPSRPLALASSKDQRLAFATTISAGDIHRRPVPDRAISGPVTEAQSQSPPNDWRAGRVSIQSIDMEPREDAEGGRSRGLSTGQAARPKAPGGMATRGRFVPSDAKNTEVGWGVVHLYRDAKETPGLDDAASSTGSEAAAGADQTSSQEFNEDECTTLCIIAVPSYMTPSDLLGFVGEQTREDVSHFRLIRTARANKYMVLMKFRRAQRAKLWRKEWNGKHFNSMEPENCHVVFVKSVEFSPQESELGPSSFPTMSNDPFTPAAYPNAHAPIAPGIAAAKAVAPPTPSLVELPTCPVCLERMDESTGLLTILCQHVFHCNCLEKWKGSGCPVCRYTQNDSNFDDQDNECSVCGSTANLWICLICGNVGCGRYDSAHAFAHFEATGHSYAMDIMTQHIWDYVGDGYVHRLIGTKVDGKVGDASGAGMTAYNNEDVPREKLDNMGMEYAYLLSSQLDSQRMYYEQQLDRAVDKASIATEAAERANRAAEELAEQVEVLQTSYGSAQANLASMEKEVQRAQKRAERAEQLARKMTKDWQEEKVVGEGLANRITFVQEKAAAAEQKVAALEAEKRDLEEQNRDLSFFISGQAKLKELEGEAAEEVQGGTLEVPVQEQGRRKKGKGRK